MSKRDEDREALVAGLAQIVRSRAEENKLALTELWNYVAVELGLAGTITTPRFYVELNDFRLMRGGHQAKETHLKLNVAWRLTHPHHGNLGVEMRNCSVKRLKEGELAFYPPRSAFGNKSAQLITATPDFGNFVIQHLDEKKYAARIGTRDVPAALLPKRLPRIVKEMQEEVVAEDWYVQDGSATGSPKQIHSNGSPKMIPHETDETKD